MKIEKIPAHLWTEFSEDAHSSVFGEYKPASVDRIDYALIAVDGPMPLGYLTAREIDSTTVYWQFGGAFPSIRGTLTSWKVYQCFLDWAKDHYALVTTLIENTNTPMLKMAMKAGFRIVGIRNYGGSILLEHLIEFERSN